MADFSLANELAALLQVLFIDLVLAGDNAIVVGMAAAAVAADKRRKVIIGGIAAAVVLRILFALVTTQLLAIVGLTLAGGLLLLWVCWKMWRDLREEKEEVEGAEVVEEELEGGDGQPVPSGGKTVRQAIVQVAVADVSMSLDNVLAVAGAAGEHIWVLVVGLIMSVALMGAAAGIIAKALVRHRWIGFLGLAIITYVALSMIWRGGIEVANAM